MRITKKVNERVYQMKYVLSLIIISLCLFVANVVATPSLAEKVAKEYAGEIDGEVVDEIDTTGRTSYRSFGMKNRRNDSAWCRIKYTPKVPSSKTSIVAALSEGETKRRDIFEKNVAFEKIIDKTLPGGQFAEYNKVNMGDCRLCIKGVVEPEMIVSSEEEPPASFTTDKKPLKEDRKKVAEENTQNTDTAKASNNKAEINFPFAISKKRVIAGVVFVLLIAIIIILILKKRKLQEQMINDDNYNIDEFTKLKKRMEEKIIENDSLRKENDRLREENERLKRDSAPIAASGSVMPPPPPVVPMVIAPPSPVVKKSTFYFSNPIGNTFNALKSTHDFEESKSLYRFERVGEDSSAEIFVVENEPRVVQRFIQSSEIQMGVCEFEGGYKKDATSIETVTPGSAVLDDGKWTVKKKIKIRYC